MSQYGVLTARLQNELKTLDKVVKTAQSQIGKAERSEDTDFYQAAARGFVNF